MLGVFLPSSWKAKAKWMSEAKCPFIWKITHLQLILYLSPMGEHGNNTAVILGMIDFRQSGQRLSDLLKREENGWLCEPSCCFTHNGKKKVSHSLLQVCLDFNNKVEGFESSCQPLTIYVGASAIILSTVRFEVHVVYDEAMTTRAGIHFIILWKQKVKEGRRIRIHNWRLNRSLKAWLVATYLNTIPAWSALWSWSKRICPRGCGIDMC